MTGPDRAPAVRDDARALPGLGLARLAAYLDRVAPELVGGPLRGTVLAGGKSNLTYEVTDGRSRFVVRRPPLGHVLATAHDMGREYRVLHALAPTRVPVPGVLLHCPDPEVLGAPFYLMRFVEGRVYRVPAELTPLGPDQVTNLARSLVETLGHLHAVPPASVGLAGFGRPDGFAARQVRRWKTQIDASRSRDLPGVEELHDRLAAAVPPAGAATVVHGDFRLDNAVVGAGGGIRAVLDWEMSTLGDPLTDLGLLLVYSARLAAPGWPDAEGLAAEYARRTGRDLSDLGWYVAFASFKLAAILEGVHYRYVRGQTVGPGFDRVGEQVPPLIAQGLTTLGGA
ncbi:aminoglycoside phosphotransferase (APT) family kinase protein [Micromonospora pisi]|uniref:Aminoglycoside phosphotransferase (APT) family kinase protein n=1 Tax=Micromonospora pisi TaxID=589240 RepID=A0A495JAP6_9ACTN|nr:phosphotransferase family protein [Micromonospora pisi]RKR85997.1 aminoglycoside phosphotransferase (APT) family kinase protein [Micromonospora pisi]